MSGPAPAQRHGQELPAAPSGSALSACAGPRFTVLAREALRSWVEHRGSTIGAALAFYTLFSIAPILVIATAVAGAAFGPVAAHGEMSARLGGLIGKGGADAMQALLAASHGSGGGLWTGLLASAAFLYAATSLFAELKDSMDVIWGSPQRTGPLRGLWSLLRGRLLSLALILAMGVLLLLSVVASAVLAALQRAWGGGLDAMGWLLEGINALFSLMVVFALFASIYRWLPERAVAWRDAFVGAGVSAALFTLGKVLIGLYMGNTQAASGFGTAGSLVALLLWVYYSAQIFFLGAEFTRAYATAGVARYEAMAHRDAGLS